MFTTCGGQETFLKNYADGQMCVHIFEKKMLLGATSGEHIGSTLSVIYILLTPIPHGKYDEPSRMSHLEISFILDRF